MLMKQQVNIFGVNYSFLLLLLTMINIKKSTESATFYLCDFIVELVLDSEGGSLHSVLYVQLYDVCMLSGVVNPP